MRRILIILFLLVCYNSDAQEFRFEARFYLLQNYIRQNAIKTITLGKSDDSLAARQVNGLTLEFDELGRLILIEEPFTPDRKKRVSYTYEGPDRIYATKQNYRPADSLEQPELIYKWEIITSKDGTRTDEIQRLDMSNADDTLRKNFILYDDQQRMIYRRTSPLNGNIMTAEFNYNDKGNINRFVSGYCAPANSDSCFGGETFTFQYDDLDRVSEIRGVKQTVDNSGKLTRQISFYYNEAGTVFVTDSAMYVARNYQNYQLVTKYHGRIDFHTIDFNESGLVSLIWQSNTYDKQESYLAFSYTFHEGPRVRSSSVNNGAEFLLYYFAPFDWKKLY